MQIVKANLQGLFYSVCIQGDLGSYIQKKGRLKTHKALRFALDIARHVF